MIKETEQCLVRQCKELNIEAMSFVPKENPQKTFLLRKEIEPTTFITFFEIFSLEIADDLHSVSS